MRAFFRREPVLLACVFLLALAVRAVYLWGQAENDPLFDYPQMDGLVHHKWASRIAAGLGMEPRPYLRAPLYYYLLGGLYALTGPNVALARIAGAVLGAASCSLIALLAMRLHGRRAGLLAGVLAALYWPLIYFDTNLLTAGLEVFLNTALLIVLLAAGRRRSGALFLLAGVVWGLSAITRPNVLAVAPVIWLWAWWTSRQPLPHGRGSDRGGTAVSVRRYTGLGAVVLVTAGMLAAVLPVTIRNWVVGHEPVLIASTGGINFYIGNNPRSDGFRAYVPEARPTWDEWLVDIKRIPEVQVGRPLSDRAAMSWWAGRAWAWIGNHPAAALGHTVHKLRLFWSPVEIPNNQPIGFLFRRSGLAVLMVLGFPVIAVLALPALALLGLRRGPWRLLAALGFVYMLTVVAFFCPARYRMPVTPILIVAAAAGVVQAVDWARARRLRPLAAYALIGLICAAVIATNPPERRAFAVQDEAEGHYLLGRHFATPPPDGPGDLVRAAEEYRLAVQADGAVHRRLDLARVLSELDRYPEAAAEYGAAVNAAPQDAAARVQYAQFLVVAGKLPEAADQYRAAVRLAPHDLDVAAQLGSLLSDLNQPAEAVRVLREVVAARPTVGAQFKLGVALLRQGQMEEAERTLTQVTEQDAQHALGWQHLGVARARLGRMDGAIAAFRQALRADPTLAESSVNLARALRKTGRHAEARPVLEAALERSPADAQVLAALATLLACAPQDELRDGARAKTLAQQAVALGSSPALPALDALAAAQAEVGQLAEAAATARRALDMARAGGSNFWVAEFQKRLAAYETGRPWRE